MDWQLPIGAQFEAEGVRFCVWAPDVRKVDAVILDDRGKEIAACPLQKGSDGYFSGRATGMRAGTRYMYRLDEDKTRPDPASRYQPEGVHGPSQVVDPSFAWNDSDWNGIPLEQYVIYEVHPGTATPDGTFEALIEKLPYFKSLGVTAIEVMPIADFPGERNWGYDGVNLFAPARAYGGPEGFKKLVNAAHEEGLAVVLDVVYNHLGPDGNYLRDFSGHYFTSEKKTPWGDALDFSNSQVREFFISNAIYWAHEYRVDGLRLDATHAILDDNERHILEEIPARVRETLPTARNFVIFAEDERNQAWLVRPPREGGAGIDAVWADDFHHEIRSSLAGDNEGYYADYTGTAEDIAETLTQGWFYTGQVSTSAGQARGTAPTGIDPPHFVFCIQNHDQVGNRALGDRLTESIDIDAYRAASALLLLSPYTPLLFQGQEWAASTPFIYFTDHNPELGRMITKGRKDEFAHFKGFSADQVPDPQAKASFEASKLNWDEVEQGDHGRTLLLYKELLALRRNTPALRTKRRDNFQSGTIDRDAIAIRYSAPSGSGDLLVIVNLKGDLRVNLNDSEITRPPEGYAWKAVLSTEERRFGGSQELELALQGDRVSAERPLALVLQASS